MPRRFTGKLCRFLADHLNRRTFRDLLKWVDKKEGRFRIGWKHGNGANATVEDYVVFLEWDKLKKRGTGKTRARKPSLKVQCHDTTKRKNTTKEKTAGHDAKQRFRSALRKMKFEVESSAYGFQIMRFPKSDLEYLLLKEQLPPSPNTSEGSDDTFAGWDDSSQLSPGHASLEEESIAFPLDNEANVTAFFDLGDNKANVTAFFDLGDSKANVTAFFDLGDNKANVTPFFDLGPKNYDADSTNITNLPGEILDACGSSDDIYTNLLNSSQLEFLQGTPTYEPLMQETFSPLSELLSPVLPEIPDFLALQSADQISPEERPEALLEFSSIL